jgi:hypothetical protein
MRKLWPGLDFVDEDEEQRVISVERFVPPRGGGRGMLTTGTGQRLGGRARRRKSELNLKDRRGRSKGWVGEGVRYATREGGKAGRYVYCVYLLWVFQGHVERNLVHSIFLGAELYAGLEQ